MRFRICLDDHGGVQRSIDAETERFVRALEERLVQHSLGADEWEEIEEQHRVMVSRQILSWLRSGRRVTLEFDTVLGTCTVVRAQDDELCPGCSKGPGDGLTDKCYDPLGCGYWRNWL